MKLIHLINKFGKSLIPDHMHHSHHIWKLHLTRCHQNIVRNASEFHASIWPRVLRQQEQEVEHGSQTFLIMTKFTMAIIQIMKPQFLSAPLQTQDSTHNACKKTHT